MNEFGTAAAPSDKVMTVQGVAGGIDGTVGAANDIITFGGQPYIATTAATVATSGAWKKLTIGSL